MTTDAPLELEPHDAPASDVGMSLTGFDEIAIVARFGVDVSELQAKPGMFLRALAFVVVRRRGAADSAAYKAVMGATYRQIADFFPDDPADAEGAEELGKGERPST